MDDRVGTLLVVCADDLLGTLVRAFIAFDICMGRHFADGG
jgi:hypothetical protein